MRTSKKYTSQSATRSLQSMGKYTRLHEEEDEQPRAFKVFMYKKEMQKIYEWVLMKDNIETGGDLFGLWIDQHTAVVQFVLGPGEKCRRTRASFHQDVDYLDKTGSYLTKTHGLCNIGQWHSHHRLSLTRPSGGDENTVWGNMPNLGLNRYIVFIATIKGWGTRESKASVKCFLFEIQDNQKLPVLEGKFARLEDSSPLRMNYAIASIIEDGAEVEYTEKQETSHERWNYCHCSRIQALGIVLLTGLFIAVVVLLVLYKF